MSCPWWQAAAEAHDETRPHMATEANNGGLPAPLHDALRQLSEACCAGDAAAAAALTAADDVARLGDGWARGV